LLGSLAIQALQLPLQSGILIDTVGPFGQEFLLVPRDLGPQARLTVLSVAPLLVQVLGQAMETIPRVLLERVALSPLSLDRLLNLLHSVHRLTVVPHALLPLGSQPVS